MTGAESTGLARRFEDGTAARDRDDLDEADRIFREIIAAEPTAPVLVAATYGQLGYIALWLRAEPDPELAVRYYALAVEARPRWDLEGVSEDERYAAAVIFLDGVLGEVRRLRLIREVEVVTALSDEQAARASKAERLAAHLASLATSMG